MPPSPWDAEEEGVTTLRVRLLKPLPWRAAEDGKGVEVWSEREQVWKRDTFALGALLEGLEQGRSLADIMRTMRARAPELSPAQLRGTALLTIMAMRRRGHVEIDLPEMPEVLGGRYARVKELGRGGMGVAWLCRDRGQPGEPEVVVKHAWNFTAPLALCDQALREEAEVLQRFDHPAIVRYLMDFEVDGRYHMVREFVAGQGLASIARVGLPGEPRRRAVALQMADALAHIHARGYLALDVQPENFYLEPGDKVRLGDLGLCKPMTDGQVVLPRPVGARGFVAPEVMAKQPATVRSDVCAFGRLYYTLVLGRRPSQRADAAKMAEEVRAGGGSEAEAALVQRLSADDPAQRPATMAEVAALLRA